MGIRILVIEDEDEIADFLVRGLREESFAVERAADGEEAWHYLSTRAWDAVLLDWWLPGIDGITLLKRFRQVNRTTPVLFLTARDAVSDRVRGLDLVTQSAERAGNKLDLTSKEHGLLLFFLRHPGEVLSRTRIYEHVWDERFDGLSNTLEVHVFELRRKLEAHGPRLIHTLRGRGYVLGDAAGVGRKDVP